MKFDIPFTIDSPKMLRETLCLAETAVLHKYGNNADTIGHIRRLQNLIKQIDVMRPLGADGKHGDLHTENCGCLYR